MNYRTVLVHALETLATSGTKTIPINVQDPITSLDFFFLQTVDDADRIAPEVSSIKRLEIVDGSNVLLSLTGEQVVALSVYEGHNNIMFMASNLRSMEFAFNLHVYFGRYLGDPLLALDPRQFRNLQIKITYDCALVSVGSTPLKVSIIAECFDEKVVSPVGFLRQTEHNSYTGGVTTWEYISLPTDLPIRKLYLQKRDFGQALATGLTEVKLTEDNDKRIPFALEDGEWSRRCMEMFGEIHQNIYMLGENTRTAYCVACESMLPAIMNGTTITAVRTMRQIGGTYNIQTEDMTDLCVGHMHGYIPYEVLCYPFGDQQDINDWYDLTNVGQLEWRVRSGARGASSTYHTILQQLRRY